MRIVLMVAVLGYSSFLVSCMQPTKSSAEQYLSQQAGADSNPTSDGIVIPNGDVNPPTPATPTPATPTTPTPATPTPATPTPSVGVPAQPTTATGDAAKGLALIKSTCANCHVAGGLGKAPLNKSYVTRLDTAFTGKDKAYHESYKSSKADLEAALKTLN